MRPGVIVVWRAPSLRKCCPDSSTQPVGVRAGGDRAPFPFLAAREVVAVLIRRALVSPATARPPRADVPCRTARRRPETIGGGLEEPESAVNALVHRRRARRCARRIAAVSRARPDRVAPGATRSGSHTTVSVGPATRESTMSLSVVGIASGPPQPSVPDGATPSAEPPVIRSWGRPLGQDRSDPSLRAGVVVAVVPRGETSTSPGAVHRARGRHAPQRVLLAARSSRSRR